jgi:hypothetical protein
VQGEHSVYLEGAFLRQGQYLRYAEGIHHLLAGNSYEFPAAKLEARSTEAFKIFRNSHIPTSVPK